MPFGVAEMHRRGLRGDAPRGGGALPGSDRGRRPGSGTAERTTASGSSSWVVNSRLGENARPKMYSMRPGRPTFGPSE